MQFHGLEALATGWTLQRLITLTNSQPQGDTMNRTKRQAVTRPVCAALLRGFWYLAIGSALPATHPADAVSIDKPKQRAPCV